MALADDINALPITVGDGNTGHLNNHQVIHAALKDHEQRLRDLITVDTTVGTRILAGNTVIYGDTGWRDITSLLTVQPNSGKLRVRRTNGGVHLEFASLTFNAGVVSEVQLPQAWWTGVSVGGQLHHISGSLVAQMFSTWAGLIRFTWNTNQSAADILSLASKSAWPTAMIGVE